MLVLTRKSGERIVINDQITVTVLKVQGSQIHLGIEAPKEIPIMREELIRSAAAAWGHPRNHPSPVRLIGPTVAWVARR